MSQIVVILCLFPALAQATTYYVSQTATNGYIVGVDGNAGTAKGTAKLTIESAYGAASDGDTIVINDGTYVAATNFNAGTSKGLTVNCETDYACILRASAGNEVWQTGIPAAGAWTFGKVVLDADNTRLRCLTISNNVAISTMVLNGTKCLNPIDGGIIDTKNNLTITMTNVIFSASALSGTNTTGGLYWAADHRTGDVTINGVATTATNAAAVARWNVYVSRTTGSTALAVNISNMTGTLSTGNNSASSGWVMVRVENIDDASIHHNTMTIQNGYTVVGAQITSATAGAQTAHRGNIHHNTWIFDGGTAGYCAVVGQVATANQVAVDSSVIADNVCTWTATPAGQVPHGVVLGYSVDGVVRGNTVTNSYVCAMGSPSTRGVITGNLCINTYGFALYAKGSTDLVIANNTVRQANSWVALAPACLGLVQFSAIDSTGIVFANNICDSRGDAGAKWVFSDTNGAGTFDNNVFYTDQALATTQWSYRGATDNTLAGWNARAQVGTDLQVDPLFVSVSASNYRLNGNSTLRRAGIAGKPCKDFRGRPCWMPPDVGAYQSTSGDPAVSRTARQ